MTGPPGVGVAWPGSRALVNDTRAPSLDLSAAVGQMQYTFRFALTDGVSGQVLDDITPIRNAVLSHNTGQITKRSLKLPLGAADTAAVNTLTDRVNVFMVIPGVPCPDTDSGDWPLGRYQFVDDPRRVSTSGRLANDSLTDEMFLIDQPIQGGLNGARLSVSDAILKVLEGLPVVFGIEPSPFLCAESWGVGTNRGQILEALSVSGAYFSPWFDNTGTLRFIRSFNPADVVPDLDLDTGYRVLRADILETSELLTAPNTFIVISNNSNTPDVPCFAVATVPVNAPNSVPARGFAITRVLDLQLSTTSQAQAVADGLIQRSAIFEQVELSTPADPRHDSYNVIRWRGVNWLELAWTMPLTPGAPMTHRMRRSYT
jgi:hypothetical protein